MASKKLTIKFDSPLRHPRCFTADLVRENGTYSFIWQPVNDGNQPRRQEMPSVTPEIA